MAHTEQREELAKFLTNSSGSAKQFWTGVPGHINDSNSEFFNIPLLQRSCGSVSKETVKNENTNIVIEGILLFIQ